MIYEDQAVALIAQLQSGSSTVLWQHGESQGGEEWSKVHNDIPLSPFIFFFKIFFPSTLLSSLQSYSCFLCAFSFPQAFFLCRELWPTELYPWHPCSLLRGSVSVPVSLNRREQRSREIQSMVKARKSAVRYGGEGRVRGEGRREGKICLARR